MPVHAALWISNNLLEDASSKPQCHYGKICCGIYLPQVGYSPYTTEKGRRGVDRREKRKRICVE